MNMALNTERLNISRLRLHGGGRDPMLTRLRVSKILASASLAPPDISPAAILIVRKFKDPLPGKMVSNSGAIQLSPDWEQAVRSQMSALARRALRPIQNEVDGTADAVLFADEAELVACLVRDWLRGRVADRWWWRSVLGDLSPPQWLRLHVLARGEVMVPAIAILAARLLAAAWLERLDDAEAEEAMVAIERTHGLSLATTQYHSTARRPRASDDHPGLAGIADSEPQADARSVAFERLITTVPEARAPSLRSPQRRLLALSLALTRAPSWARTRQLAIALQALGRADMADHARGFLVPDAGQTGTRKLLVAGVATGDGMPIVGESGKPHSGLQDTAGAVATPPRKHEETQLSSPTQASLANLETLNPTQIAGPMVTQVFLGRESEAQRETLPAPAAMGAHPEEAPVIDDSTRVHTMFGGIFYLLNAAIALELYSDFTAPRGKNLTLSPWDWLTLVGRAWFPRQFVCDPVSGLLAELAGRKGGTLRRPRWFKVQMRTLRARLARALVETKLGDIPALVCRHRAEVCVTASRVDVHLALAELPLGLRIAGLDRDIGWIPAAGRAVHFHFA